MDSAELRAMQAPLKDTYRNNPKEALVTLWARGQLDDQAVACSVAKGRDLAVGGPGGRRRRVLRAPGRRPSTPATR
jgi:hypothetical protein